MKELIIIDDPHDPNLQPRQVEDAPCPAPARQLADEMAAARVAHMNRGELAVAERMLHVPRGTIEGPPVGVIVGEAPGPNTHSRLPMFPFPPTSAGGRLMAMSGIPPHVFLGRFIRRNLFETYAASTPWAAKVARERAQDLAKFVDAAGPFRVVLCGARVAEAFGIPLWGRATSEEGRSEYVSIAHPSGVSRTYNDPKAREAARRALLWAAELA